MPVYIRRPPESQPLPEEHELLWDDGVAPELCLDFEMPHQSPYESLAWFSCGIGAFVLYGFFVWGVLAPMNPERAVKRELPYDGLKEELGGYTLSET